MYIHKYSASPMSCFTLWYTLYKSMGNQSCTISETPILNKICLHHWETKEYTLQKSGVLFIVPFLWIQNLGCSNWIDLYRILRQKKLPHKMTNLQCRQKTLDLNQVNNAIICLLTVSLFSSFCGHAGQEFHPIHCSMLLLPISSLSRLSIRTISDHLLQKSLSLILNRCYYHGGG